MTIPRTIVAGDIVTSRRHFDPKGHPNRMVVCTVFDTSVGARVCRADGIPRANSRTHYFNLGDVTIVNEPTAATPALHPASSPEVASSRSDLGGRTPPRLGDVGGTLLITDHAETEEVTP